jgi:enolase
MLINMPSINSIKAREILDSRGNPTLEVAVKAGRYLGVAAVPSGASTGKYEAVELRDNTKRYHGKGVQKAIKNVSLIHKVIKSIEVKRQKEIDSLMIEFDNTKNKSKLGANAMLGVSLACSRAAAQSSNRFLFEYINTLLPQKNMSMPRAFFNVINGGKHADNKLSIQEFMIAPNLKTFKKNLQVASEIYHTLKKLIHKKFGKGETNVGDEGGFAPKIKTSQEALSLITKAINKSGYKGKCDIAMDAAASEFYKKGKYQIDGKTLTKEKLTTYYLNLIKKHPIISIEDPFEENDFNSFANLKKQTKIQIVGDDLTVTNPDRIEKAIKENSCNCLLLKVNQIGTFTEALKAVTIARNQGWKIMVSHRSGETEDTFIADLAVGIGASQIKAGAPCRGERTAKYNQLLRIEELLYDTASSAIE